MRDLVTPTHGNGTEPRDSMNTRWFGVTWMRSSAPPHILFVWLRFGRKRKLDV